MNKTPNPSIFSCIKYIRENNYNMYLKKFKRFLYNHDNNTWSDLTDDELNLIINTFINIRVETLELNIYYVICKNSNIITVPLLFRALLVILYKYFDEDINIIDDQDMNILEVYIRSCLDTYSSLDHKIYYNISSLSRYGAYIDEDNIMNIYNTYSNQIKQKELDILINYLRSLPNPFDIKSYD